MTMGHCDNCETAEERLYSRGSHDPRLLCEDCRDQERWEEWYGILFESWGWA